MRCVKVVVLVVPVLFAVVVAVVTVVAVVAQCCHRCYIGLGQSNKAEAEQVKEVVVRAVDGPAGLEMMVNFRMLAEPLSSPIGLVNTIVSSLPGPKPVTYAPVGVRLAVRCLLGGDHGAVS